ncbi:TPA: hypothetical protein N0F65_004647 [Lagenidium giganteum]|uniref:PDZ domain-containing protein n=1 Tax=Lagenidium giganteum TaxID=4803 RepID=A0AAV2ZBN4_9STRA|nr:TPA: hypothetical protein N0F65_004647 [Lagenidium giganteum]
MDTAKRREVLALAEQGAWEDVLDCIEHDPVLAKAQDDFGMLPLHWACTEPSIALDTVQTILSAYPEACEVENLSGMLPLHVAISSKLPGLHMSALLKVYPDAAFAKDGKGVYPVEAAIANNLPTYTIDVIRKAGIRAVRSSSLEQLPSGGDNNPASSSSNQPELLKSQSMGPLMASRRASEFARFMDNRLISSRSMSAMDSAVVSTQLKDLLSQLQQLSCDIRSSASPSTTSRSSFSSSSSGSNSFVNSILWNPGDKLGLTFEPAAKDEGAKISSISSKSCALGVEKLKEGDVLVSINGTSVVGTNHASILRFLKRVKVTCKLCFSKGSGLDYSQVSIDSYGNQMVDQESILLSKVSEMLNTTLEKVSAVEETVRLSSAMSFCS